MIGLVVLNLLAAAWTGGSVFFLRQQIITKRGAVWAPLFSLLLSLAAFAYVLLIDYMIYSGIQC